MDNKYRTIDFLHIGKMCQFKYESVQVNKHTCNACHFLIMVGKEGYFDLRA